MDLLALPETATCRDPPPPPPSFGVFPPPPSSPTNQPPPSTQPNPIRIAVVTLQTVSDCKVALEARNEKKMVLGGALPPNPTTPNPVEIGSSSGPDVRQGWHRCWASVSWAACHSRPQMQQRCNSLLSCSGRGPGVGLSQPRRRGGGGATGLFACVARACAGQGVCGSGSVPQGRAALRTAMVSTMAPGVQLGTPPAHIAEALPPTEVRPDSAFQQLLDNVGAAGQRNPW